MSIEYFEILSLYGRPPCEPAMDWLRGLYRASPDATPDDVWRDCARGDWLLWWLEAEGVCVSAAGFWCAERARQHALSVLPPSAERDRLASCAPIVDAETAYAAARAAESAAARAASYASVRAAVRAAAYAAAESAAESAARAAAESAAYAAVRAAAYAAVRAASYASVRAAAREEEFRTAADYVRANYECPWRPDQRP